MTKLITLLSQLGLIHYWGIFHAFHPIWVLLGCVSVVVFLGYFGAYFFVWSLALLGILWGFGASKLVLLSTLGVLALFNLVWIRQWIVSAPVMAFLKAMKFLPTISDTERVAIEAGNVWVDGELFSGKPSFKRLLKEGYPDLTAEEQAFLDGPCETLCKMVDDWNVHQRRDFSQEIWDYMKAERFFGMIIPVQYGGLGFSPLMNSAVVSKLSSRSTPLGITVMVPNSLGPAELLVHYGTKEQKDFYLPRLAVGKEVPCFALTEPTAGSDAGSISSFGIVFLKDNEPWIRLTWRKRYITLAAISTVLGLAFKLRDPENILGKGVDLGITCALIPTKTSGVILGKRHDPLGVPFYNCPTEGTDVEVPVAAIIGGVNGVGQGWRMLMESLAAGRGISLPANATGGVKLVARVTGAYAAIRKQFGISIGKFEGIEEPLARIGGYAYMLEAGRRYTCGGLNKGEKPPVVTAMAKYMFTELFRKSINDGMDIMGGAGISMGPRNLLAHPYIATPIGVTVEGANILTRTLIVFGQGAIRCHPYVLKELQALESGSVSGFDRSFWKHVGHVVRNFFRFMVLSVTSALFVLPPVFGRTKRYYQKLSWASAQFALFADVALGTMGGTLKRKEKITGRYADILTWMYLATAVLRRFEAEGRRKEDLPFVEWSLQTAFAEMQIAFEGIFANMGFMYKPVRCWVKLFSLGSMPSDDLGSKVAQLLQQPSEQRDRLTRGIHIPQDEHEALGRLELAFKAIHESQYITKRIMTAVKDGKLAKGHPDKLVKHAVELHIITPEEAEILIVAEKYRRDAIQVDDYTLQDYARRSVTK